MSGALGTKHQSGWSFFVRGRKREQSKIPEAEATKTTKGKGGLDEEASPDASSLLGDGNANGVPNASGKVVASPGTQTDSKGLSSALFGFSRLLGSSKSAPMSVDTPKPQKSFASGMLASYQELKQKSRKQKARQEACALLKALLQAESQARFNLPQQPQNFYPLHIFVGSRGSTLVE